MIFNKKTTGQDNVPQAKQKMEILDEVEIAGYKYIKTPNGLFLENINELDLLPPIKVNISKETGKIVVGDANLVKSVTGIILQYWTANVLFEDNHLICSAVNNKPIVDNPKAKNCSECELNKFVDGVKKCKNMIVMLLKSPEYALPLKITLPPTNISSFRKATLLPIAQGIPLHFYDVTFTTQEKVGKRSGMKYFNYAIEFQKRETIMEFFNEYAEYATKFFDFVSKNRIEGHDVKIVDVNEEDTEVSDADLPF